MHRVFWCARDHVLTASSPLNQKQTSQPICRDFQNGRCFRSRCVSNGKQEFLREREREREIPKGNFLSFFFKRRFCSFCLFEIEIETKDRKKLTNFYSQINITTVADFSTELYRTWALSRANYKTERLHTTHTSNSNSSNHPEEGNNKLAFVSRYRVGRSIKCTNTNTPTRPDRNQM